MKAINYFRKKLHLRLTWFWTCPSKKWPLQSSSRIKTNFGVMMHDTWRELTQLFFITQSVPGWNQGVKNLSNNDLSDPFTPILGYAVVQSPLSWPEMWTNITSINILLIYFWLPVGFQEDCKKHTLITLFRSIC